MERAAAARDTAVREAVERWEEVAARTVSLRQSVENVATTTGVTPREIRAIARRRP